MFSATTILRSSTPPLSVGADAPFWAKMVFLLVVLAWGIDSLLVPRLPKSFWNNCAVAVLAQVVNLSYLENEPTVTTIYQRNITLKKVRLHSEKSSARGGPRNI